MATNDECTIAVCGPVDAGKSSLIGVLTSGQLDNGKGFARTKVLKHAHELESGRTSNITFNPLIYRKNKDGIKLLSVESKKEILKVSDKECNPSDKVISFIDLAGHEKYLKTTVFGVTGLFPDYGLVIIGANTGITKLTREHIGILYYLKIPLIICITKIDLAPKHVYQQLCNRLKNLLTKNHFKKITYFISDSDSKDDETNKYINDMINNIDIIPIISISNKDGTNIKNLHSIISEIPKRKKWEKNVNDGSIVYLDNTFSVPGIGLILSGMVKGKDIKVKDKLYLGPLNGIFFQLQIRSIHNAISENVLEAKNELQCCFAIKFLNPKLTLDRKQIKKGMVLIDSLDKWKNNIVKKFSAKITILQHSTTIKSGYSPVIHCGPIRQAAKLELEDDIQLRSGDTCIINFSFIYHSEFMEENMIFFFRDGNTKGVGEVIKLIQQ